MATAIEIKEVRRIQRGLNVILRYTPKSYKQWQEDAPKCNKCPGMTSCIQIGNPPAYEPKAIPSHKDIGLLLIEPFPPSRIVFSCGIAMNTILERAS